MPETITSSDIQVITYNGTYVPAVHRVRKVVEDYGKQEISFPQVEISQEGASFSLAALRNGELLGSRGEKPDEFIVEVVSVNGNRYVIRPEGNRRGTLGLINPHDQRERERELELGSILIPSEDIMVTLRQPLSFDFSPKDAKIPAFMRRVTGREMPKVRTIRISEVSGIVIHPRLPN